MRRVQVGPITKMISRAKLRDWSAQRGNQAGMAAAGRELTEGAMEDPYGSIARSIGTFFSARNQDRQRASQEEMKMAELAIERERQAKLDARADEEYSLRKRSLEGELSAAEEKRLMAEQQRVRTADWIKTLSPEDQALLGPLEADPERAYSVYDRVGDDRRAAAQYERDRTERERATKAQEGFEERRLRLEAQRIAEARDARAAELARKPESQNKVIERDGQLVTYSPDGEVIKTVPIPRSSAEREAAILKLMSERAMTVEEASAAVDKLDAMRRPPPPPEPGSDADIKTLVDKARSEGASDEEILQSLAGAPVVYRAKVMKLLGLLPKRQ